MQDALKRYIEANDGEAISRLGQSCLECLPGGELPLVLAVRLGRLVAAKALLELGADPNISLDGVGGGESPLMLARAAGDQELVTLLETPAVRLASRGETHTALAADLETADGLIPPSHPWRAVLAAHLAKNGGESRHRCETAAYAIMRLADSANGTSAQSLAKISFEVAYGRGVKFVAKQRALLKGQLRAALRGRGDASSIHQMIECLLPWHRLFSEDGEVGRGHVDPRHAADFLASAAGSTYQFTMGDTPTKSEVDGEMARLSAAIGKWEAGFGESGKSEARQEIDTVMELSDGYRLVKLLTAAAMAYEGRVMEHCVGDGHYDWLIGSDNKHGLHGIYSIRNPEGEPRATLEVEMGHLTQIKGRKNGHVSPDAMPATIEATSRLGLPLDEREIRHIGCMVAPKDFERIGRATSFVIEGRKYIYIQSIRIADDFNPSATEATEAFRSLYLDSDSLPDLSTMEHLAALGTNFGPNARRTHGAMQIAARTGRLDIVRFLVERNYPVYDELSRWRSPLDWSADEGHQDIVEYLLNHGANDRHDKKKALLHAAREGHQSIVKLLVNSGGVHSDDLFRATLEAAVTWQTSVVKILLQIHTVRSHPSIPDALVTSVVNGDLETATVFAEAGIKIPGSFRLSLVVEDGNLKILKLLIEKCGAQLSPGCEEELAVARESMIGDPFPSGGPMIEYLTSLNNKNNK